MFAKVWKFLIWCIKNSIKGLLIYSKKSQGNIALLLKKLQNEISVFRLLYFEKFCQVLKFSGNLVLSLWYFLQLWLNDRILNE